METWAIRVAFAATLLAFIPLAESLAAAPSAPSNLTTVPPSPSFENLPNVSGNTDPGTTVRLWSDAACTQLLASGSAESFSTSGIPVEVPENTITNIYADATDGVEDSGCSTKFVTYVEDSIPPESPTDLATVEFCRVNHNTPEITGQAPAGTTITLYRGSLCSSFLGTGTSEQFSGDGIEIFVPENQLTSIFATARDEAGNESACSQDSVGYIEDSIGPPLDPRVFGQHGFIKASNTGNEDYFGDSVAISGDTLVVGAWAEDSGATGIDGIEDDSSAEDSGAVYVYILEGSRWVQEAYIKASNTGAGDHFGASVAIDGDTLVIGAPGESSSVQGIDNNQDNDSAPEAGAVYVFERDGATWSQAHYIKGSNTEASDLFGSQLSVEDKILLVGAPGERSNTPGVNGNQDNNSLEMAGAAYVFVRDGNSWVQQAYLKATNPDAQDRFGGSGIAISGYTIAIGAVGESSNATKVNGDPDNNLSENSGAVYVYGSDGTQWSVQAYIKAHNADPFDNFGTSVAITKRTLVVGAPGESSASRSNGGHAFENSTADSGASYMYGAVWDGNWEDVNFSFIKASNAETGDQFGHSLDFNGRTLVVGAIGEDSASRGAGGDQADNTLTNSGAVFVFRRNQGNAFQESYIKANTPGLDDAFGHRIALYEDTAIIGTRHEDSNTKGTHGDETDNSLTDAGAAWVLRDTTIFTDSMERGIDYLVIPDPALACCIQHTAERSRWKHASQAEGLSCSYRSIKSITGLEALTNLGWLGLTLNMITDISPLAALHDLIGLELGSNRITSVEPLMDLVELEELSLQFNNIEDLTPLSALTNLTDLNVWGNNIESLAPLENLTQLRFLYIGGSQRITDLTPLMNMTELVFLSASTSSISSLTPLSGLAKLTTLNVRSNQLINLDGVQNLLDLDNLHFDRNQITDLTPLNGLNLRSIYGNDNQIGSLASLHDLPQLEVAYFHNNMISDISGLQKFDSLVVLYLQGNRISDVSPILSLPSLILLDLTDQGQYLDCAQQQTIVAAYPGITVEVDGFWDDPEDNPDQGLINCFP